MSETWTWVLLAGQKRYFFAVSKEAKESKYVQLCLFLQVFYGRETKEIYDLFVQKDHRVK